MTSSSEITGKIEEFPLHDVLQWIHLSRRTGRLSLRSEAQDGEIEFQHGNIVRAYSSTGFVNIGNLLVNKGAISARQLREAADHQKQRGDGAPLGRVLIDLGYATVMDIHAAMRIQVEEVIDDLMEIAIGRFQFRALSGSLDNITQDVSDVLLEVDLASELERLGIESPQTTPNNGFDRREGSVRRGRAELALGDLKDRLEELRQTGASKRIEGVVATLGRYAERIVFYAVEADQLRAVAAHGSGNDGTPLHQSLSQLCLERGSALAADRCAETARGQRGVFSMQGWPKSFVGVVGEPSQPETQLSAFRSDGRVGYVAYMDNDDTGRQLPPEEFVELLIVGIELMLDAAALRDELDEAGPSV